jgi:dTDP-4-amino-4,6-dideoxygalactose transaminase
MTSNRIFLSYPELTQSDIQAINEAIYKINNKDQDKNNLIELFESELANFHNVSHAVALSSGTSAIHLALLALKIREGDRVIVPTLTFAATAFPLSYVGATPIFVDVCRKSWTLDLEILEAHLKKCKKSDLPKLIISVDLFGRTCDYDELFRIAGDFAIPVIIDAAESLGTKYKEIYTASQGVISILSFNFNKIMTTTGGGALLTNDALTAKISRKLGNQARDDFHWYEHSEIGYNYRISPILAAMGRTQLGRIETIIEKRRRIRDNYLEFLGDIPGLDVNTDSHWERSNAWLSTIKLDSKIHFKGRDIVRDNLEKENIESRFIWKPLHLQPVFKSSEAILTGVSEEIFNTGLCLPSSHTLTENEILRVSKVIKKSLKGNINL